MSGVRVRMSQRDRDAIRRHHAPYFEAWKREWGHRQGGDRLEWIPGFVESIRSLMEQGYSQTDIAMFLGVSSARLNQYAQAYGLEQFAPKCTALRVFDHALNRFVPVARLEAVEAERTRRERSREQAAARRLSARTLLVKTSIQTFVAEQGRPPSASELAGALGRGDDVNPTAFARGYLGKDAKGVRRLDAIYAELGHTRPRHNGYHFRKHPLPSPTESRDRDD